MLRPVSRKPIPFSRNWEVQFDGACMRLRKSAIALSATICLIVGALLLSLASRLKAAPEFALQFDGVDDRVTFGSAAGTGAGGLGAQSFTLELWFMRTGIGVSTST